MVWEMVVALKQFQPCWRESAQDGFVWRTIGVPEKSGVTWRQFSGEQRSSAAWRGRNVASQRRRRVFAINQLQKQKEQKIQKGRQVAVAESASGACGEVKVVIARGPTAVASLHRRGGALGGRVGTETHGATQGTAGKQPRLNSQWIIGLLQCL